MSDTSYITVEKEADDSFVEKRSKFIGYCRPVSTQQEALDFINRIKAKHWDARHNVYAYCLRENQVKRYSDDGEPQGTAGTGIFPQCRACTAGGGNSENGAVPCVQS